MQVALWNCTLEIVIYNNGMKNKYSNKYLIETGIGLQDVDKLKNSSYFLNESNRYIKGEISLDELDEIINSYYKSKPSTNRSEEADKIAVKISKCISDDSFTFTVGQLLSIHKTLFENVFEHAGKLRSYNFIKKEWVLDGESVTYGDFHELESTLQYDFELERNFKYKNLSIDQIINHLANFIANLWQIHVFEEGNTRTVAVFFIKYLRSLGFDVTNDVFAKNAWYFRNALVRANYNNIIKGIYEDNTYLIKFLRNLLLNEKNELNNKELHVGSITDKENTKESRILKHIETNPYIKTDDLASLLGISVRTIKSVLKTLVENKTIVRVNGKRYGYWKITKRHYLSEDEMKSIKLN